MDNGWIKLHRAIQSNPIWNSEAFSRGQAFVDLLLLANHKDSFFYKRGNKVIVKRGQVGRSEVELSDRWKWSRTKVRKFLKDLEKEQQVIIHKSRVTQLVTIVNYDNYQEKEQRKNNRKTTEEQQKDTYKNDKKEKNTYIGLENIEIPSNFDNELIETFAAFIQMRKEIKKPYKSQVSIQTKMNSLSKQIDKFGRDTVLDAITLSLENQYQGIKVSWLNDGNKSQPKELEIMDYYKAKLTPDKYEWLKSGKHKFKNRTPYIEIIQEDWKKNKQLYIDAAAEFKNKTVTPAFLCDICKGILSYTIGGANPKSTISFFKQWYKTQSDKFNIDAVDIRTKVINEYKYKNQTQLANFI